MESNHSAGPQDEGNRELAAKQPINPLNFTCPSQLPLLDDFGSATLSSMMDESIHSALLNTYPKQVFPHLGGVSELLQKPIFKGNVSEISPNQSSISNSFSGFATEARPHTSYSASGFDLLKVLAYLANRPNPTINIGPVDLSCAFLLVDVCKPDLPIVYSSPTFQTLTGYATHEVIGRNCRFLQSPDGWVASGSRRKFTDNAQVLTMKQEIGLFREHQSSIVNYKKGGKPFINLLTMIPIFENGFVNYYVGLQVDLVEQPGAIMKHMQDGKYAVKYGIHTFTKEVKPEDPFLSLANLFVTSDASGSSKAIAHLPSAETLGLAQTLIEDFAEFIHVLSLRGTFLYTSPGVEKLLGYTPTELVGKALADICHPGDILPVLRDLKEASNSGSACLLYRGIIKSGGFTWLESVGKLYSDGRGRKCMIFSSRIRPVYQLSYRQLLACGGEVACDEMWLKLSTCGMLLHVGPSCANLLGLDPKELSGASLYQFMPPDQSLTLTLSLEQACAGKASRMIHGIQNKAGKFIDVVSVLFPGSGPEPPLAKPEFILCRTKVAKFQAFHSPNSASTPAQNLFGALAFSTQTSWQYELQQLRISNRKLREEIDRLTPTPKKRKPSSRERYCRACLRNDTPEWRRGPEGPSTLCNPCGLKYAKGISPYAT